MNDNSIMPFGKYKGKKLIDIPDEYLTYLYNQGNLYGELKEYIEKNVPEIVNRIRK